MCRPKHVEQLRNIGIINSTTWSHLVGSFYEIYIMMHGSMNIRFIVQLCVTLTKCYLFICQTRFSLLTACILHCSRVWWTHDMLFVSYGRTYSVSTLHSLQYGTSLDQFLDVIYRIQDIALFGDQAWLLVTWCQYSNCGTEFCCVGDFMSNLLGQSDIQPYWHKWIKWLQESFLCSLFNHMNNIHTCQWLH